jgi:putative phosphoribosyl transferase
MLFSSRQDAGRKLGLHLRELGVEADVVVGLPRGGVVVAAEVADILRRPLEIIVVRKIGHPRHREFAVGALAEQDVLLLDDNIIASIPVAQWELDEVIAEEQERLGDYCRKFRHQRTAAFAGRRLLLVDDGLATGATAEAAIYSARKKGAQQVILAVPIGASSACERLMAIADRVIAFRSDPAFLAVGQYYRHFLPTTDEEVLALLHHQHSDYSRAA